MLPPGFTRKLFWVLGPGRLLVKKAFLLRAWAVATALYDDDALYSLAATRRLAGRRACVVARVDGESGGRELAGFRP